MAKVRVIKEEYSGALLDLKESVLIKAKVIGRITSEKDIIIEIKADISGGIYASNAKVIVKGGWTKKITIAGGITAKKLIVNHTGVCGSVKAEKVKISNSRISGFIEGKEVKLRNVVVTGTVKADDLFW